MNDEALLNFLKNPYGDGWVKTLKLFDDVTMQRAVHLYPDVLYNYAAKECMYKLTKEHILNLWIETKNPNLIAELKRRDYMITSDDVLLYLKNNSGDTSGLWCESEYIGNNIIDRGIYGYEDYIIDKEYIKFLDINNMEHSEDLQTMFRILSIEKFDILAKIRALPYIGYKEIVDVYDVRLREE